MSTRKLLVLLLLISSLLAIYIYFWNESDEDVTRKLHEDFVNIQGHGKSPFNRPQKATIMRGEPFRRVDIPQRDDQPLDGERYMPQDNMSVDEIEAFSRSKEYCNPVEQYTKGNEGVVPQGYKLLTTHIVIRHGDRSPMNKLPNQDMPHLSCTLDSFLSITYHPLLEGFIDFMKGFGHDIPYSQLFGLYPQRRTCGEAQLTGIGTLQHLVLGAELRKTYIKKHGLISTHPDPDEIRIKSTGYTRTYQSALSFIYGLLPDYKLNRAHFKISNNLFFCDKVYSGVNCFCPAVDRLEELSNKEEVVIRYNISEFLTSIKRELGAIHDVDESQLPFVWAIMDTLMGYFCHEKPLPCVQHDDTGQKSCYSLSLIGKIWDYLDQRSVSGPIGHKRSLLIMYPLLREITQTMVNATQAKSRTKLTLYSGHDLTIKALLKALGIHDCRWPPYASRVVFELYSSGGKYFVRILYNGQDKTDLVSFCSKSDLKDNMCPLSNLQNFVFLDSLALFGQDNYVDVCLKENF